MSGASPILSDLNSLGLQVPQAANPLLASIIVVEANARAMRGAMPKYYGQVGKRCSVPNTRHASNQAFMMESGHYATGRMTAVKFALPNWFVATASSSPTGTGQELGGAGVATFHMSIKAPSWASWVPFLFSGVAAGVAADNTTLWTDLLTLPAPLEDGDYYTLRTHCITTGKIVYLNVSNLTGGIDGVMGDKMIVAASTTPDLTLGGTLTSTVTAGLSIGFYPVACVAETTKRSFLIIGDSRSVGAKDTLDRSGDVGEIARGIGSKAGYINLSVSSDRVAYWIANNTNRIALAANCTDAIVSLGINDLNSGARTAAQLEADLVTLYAQLIAVNPTMRIWGTTLTPVTTSSDSWAVTANQTAAACNADRITWNDRLRSGTTAIANLTGFIELADQVESYRNSGLIELNGVAGFMTDDGLHIKQPGYLRYKTRRVVNEAVGL